MIHGAVYKKNSAWWFSKQRNGSTLLLSTKHKTKAKALAIGREELIKGRIEKLHTWKGNGSYESCMAMSKSKRQRCVTLLRWR
jgi:hypothetical protein